MKYPAAIFVLFLVKREFTRSVKFGHFFSTFTLFIFNFPFYMPYLAFRITYKVWIFSRYNNILRL